MAGNLTVTKKKYIVSGRIMIHDGFGKGNNISKSDNRTI